MLIVKGYLSDLYDLKYIILVIIMRGKKGKKNVEMKQVIFYKFNEYKM